MNVRIALNVILLGIGLSVLSAGNKSGTLKPKRSQIASDGSGLVAHYYTDPVNWGGNWLPEQKPTVSPENWTFSKHLYTRVEPHINKLFRNQGWFSVRWKGAVSTSTGNKPDQEATYTFHIWADDGCRLYINGKRLLDSWLPMSEGDAASHRQATIRLKPGTHRITVEYFQGESLTKKDKDPIKLYWSCPERKIPKQIIPASHFSHTVADFEGKGAAPKKGKKGKKNKKRL